jgi:hypothetical protein
MSSSRAAVLESAPLPAEPEGTDAPRTSYARGLVEYLDGMDPEERAVIDGLFDLDRRMPLA